MVEGRRQEVAGHGRPPELEAAAVASCVAEDGPDELALVRVRAGVADLVSDRQVARGGGGGSVLGKMKQREVGVAGRRWGRRSPLLGSPVAAGLAGRPPGLACRRLWP